MKSPFAIAAAAALVLAQPALAQTDDTKLGKVHFETSCKPDAQKHFAAEFGAERALNLRNELHALVSSELA